MNQCAWREVQSYMGEKCDVCGWKMGEKHSECGWEVHNMYGWRVHSAYWLEGGCRWIIYGTEWKMWMNGWMVCAVKNEPGQLCRFPGKYCHRINVLSFFFCPFFLSLSFLPVPKLPLFLHRWTSDSTAHLVEEYPSLSYVIPDLDK